MASRPDDRSPTPANLRGSTRRRGQVGTGPDRANRRSTADQTAAQPTTVRGLAAINQELAIPVDAFSSAHRPDRSGDHRMTGAKLRHMPRRIPPAARTRQAPPGHRSTGSATATHRHADARDRPGRSRFVRLCRAIGSCLCGPRRRLALNPYQKAMPSSRGAMPCTAHTMACHISCTTVCRSTMANPNSSAPLRAEAAR